MLWTSVIFDPLLVLQPHRGTFTMQFSYLSISSLNHMERFDFSNTYGEMSSLSTLQRLKKKAEQKANKSPRKQIHQFYLSRCSGLTYNLSQKCILPIAKQ